MTFKLLRGRRPLGLAGLAFLVVLSWLTARPAWATHIRAGDIQAKSDTTSARNPLRIFFKMVTYTDLNSQADQRNEETIFFGDGTNATVTRFGGRGVNIGNGINRNVYYFEHTYGAPARYNVSFIGENRASSIRNIPASDTRNFYIHTQITIDPVLGANRSPILNAPAVDRAASGQVFLHNPAASDPDGDSLAFKLRVSQHDPRTLTAILASSNSQPAPVDLPGFTYPNVASGGNQVPYSGPPVSTGGPSTLDLDVRTGQMVWNAPNLTGDYNVAFVVEEWRRDGFGGRRRIGEVIRDMQINVFATLNKRPLIQIPRDTCVVAGTTIIRNVSATDQDNHTIRLTAYGGPLPPATFVQTLNQPGRAVGRFSWTTSCSDVATEPKIIVFKAEDQPGNGLSLIDERPWRVTVVGPPPTNLRATGAGATVRLTWDRYFCQNATRILIFRKENPASWTPDDCETGIPARAGYTQVGEVGVNLQAFSDDNAGRGLDRGKTYCYRIYAEFPSPAGGKSLASQEACVTLQGRAALFTNVTVDRTDATTGQITVRWTKPVSTAGFTPPVGYRLYRAEGQTPAPNAFTLVRTFSGLNDTTHVDSNLDTETKAYTYRLEFFSNVSTQPNSAVLTENAGPASSVRLNAVANALTTRIKLTWTYNVPWDNGAPQRTRIYRRDTPAGAFTLLGDTVGTRTGGTFTDRSSTLRKDQTYCYYVETVGTYGSPTLPSNLVNLSQVRCVNLASIPCPPVLTLQPINCDSLAEAAQRPPLRGQLLLYTNRLSWTLGNTPADCGRNIAYYRVLYSPTEGGTLTEIGRTPATSFVHSNLASAAGCYAVIAVDALGNESAQSNVACQDNCLLFLLPNIFTPDNDGRNDTFRPISASPVVQAKVQVFNRWGAKVYEGKASPDLTLWDGGGANRNEAGGRDTGAKATAGTYYYLIEVQFADLKRTTKTYKGWVEIMR